MEGIRVLSREQLPNGITVLIVPCNEGYEDFKKLPKMVEFEGETFGASAFNSDRGIAYYRTDVRCALPIK